jgi:arylformamidase
MKLDNLIDLSHAIVPEVGKRPFHIELVPPIGHDAVPDDQWYIMHNVAFLNHVATHIEVPYHVVENGQDLADVPLERFCGETIVLDLTRVEHGGLVTLEHVQEAAEKAGGLQRGDMVFCRFDFDQYYDKPARPRPPSFKAETIAWLVEGGMKLMGVDTGGMELPGSDPRAHHQYNHHQILDRGIPLIENLANLSRLKKSRVTVFAFPVGIRKVDSFPLRVVAVE